MRRALLAFLLLLLLPLQAANGEPPWQTLPPTPAPVAGEHTGHAKVNGISLYYASIGHGTPVVLVHGGLANAGLLGANQVKRARPALHASSSWTAAAMAARTRDAHPYGYDLMADDVVGLMDYAEDRQG